MSGRPFSRLKKQQRAERQSPLSRSTLFRKPWAGIRLICFLYLRRQTRELSFRLFRFVLIDPKLFSRAIQMETRRIIFRDVELSFRLRETEGPRLVFLHGFCEDSSMWDEFVRPFAEYALLLPDLPGFGASGVVHPLSIEDMAEAVEMMLSQAGWDSCTIIGHSMGGYVALAFAERQKKRLEGLCLFHAHPYADTEEKKAARLKSIAFIEQHGSQRYVAQLIPALFHQRRPEIESRLIERAQRHLPKGIQAALEAMAARPDRSQVLEDCPAPVAFVVGGRDAAVPAEYRIKPCLLPAVAYVEYLREVGHMGMFEEPERCRKFLRSYLADLS